MSWTKQDFQYLILRALQKNAPVATGTQIFAELRKQFGERIDENRVSINVRLLSQFGSKHLFIETPSGQEQGKKFFLQGRCQLTADGLGLVSSYPEFRRKVHDELVAF